MTSVEFCESLGLTLLCWCDDGSPIAVAVWDGDRWVDQELDPIVGVEAECSSCGTVHVLPEPKETNARS